MKHVLIVLLLGVVFWLGMAFGIESRPKPEGYHVIKTDGSRCGLIERVNRHRGRL